MPRKAVPLASIEVKRKREILITLAYLRRDIAAKERRMAEQRAEVGR